MARSYIEPKGWCGTPGKWAFSALTDYSIRLGEPAADNRYIEFYPPPYDGHFAQLQADMAAVVHVKELIKALNPFAELGVQHITTEIQDKEYIQLQVPVAALNAAIQAMVVANPYIKPISKPYNPEGFL